MESKIIKSILLTAFLVFCLSTSVKAQFKDYRRFTADAGFGFLPIRVTGVMEKPGSVTTISIIDDHQVPENPEFSLVDTLGYAANFTAHFGYILPIYANEKWSTGIKANVGFGYQTNIKAVEGLSGFILDFPQYVYFRNYSGKLDYELSAGYKYTNAALPYHLILGGIDFYLNGNTSFGFYGSLNKYSYYAYYTDGREVPMTQIREFGVKITFFN